MESAKKLMGSIQNLQHMGLEVLEDTGNCLKVKMPLEGNKNHVGIVYAGAIFTLAEFPFGVMVVQKFGIEDIYPLVGEMTIRYLAPAAGPLVVEVRISDEEWAQIERDTRAHGKMKVLREVEIKDEQGTVIAVVKATYFTVLARQ
jgi:thioesterase domain-containing protein